MAALGSSAWAQVAPSSDEWLQFQGSPDHGGATDSSPLAAPLRRVWRFEGGGGRSGLSGAAVTGSRVVAVGEDAVYSGDVTTGGLDPSIDRTAGPVASPAIGTVDGRTYVVFTEGDSKTGPDLVAYGLTRDEEQWRQPLKDVSGSGVTIDGDLVLVGDRDGYVYGFDLATGDPVAWSPKALGGGVIEAPPAASSGRLIVVTRTRDTGDVRVTALDEEDGTEDWHFTTSFVSGTGSAVSMDAEHAFFGLGSELKVHAVTLGNGTDVWTTRTRSSFSPLGAPAVADGRLFVLATSTSECALYAFDASDGSKLWDFQFQEPGIRSSPVVVGDTVFVGLDDGRVVGIDAGSGIEVWEDHTGPGPIGPLAVAGNELIASKRGSHGGLIAYETDPDGRLLHVESPTTLKLGAVLARFGLAFVAVLVVVFGLGSLGRRTAGSASGPEEPEPEEPDPEEPEPSAQDEEA